MRGSTLDSIHTTLIGGKISLGLRFKTPVRECPIAYFALIAVRTMLPYVCSFYRIVLSYFICLLLLLTALYIYHACSPPAPPTALFWSPSWSLIPFYLPASNIVLNLVLRSLSLVPALLMY